MLVMICVMGSTLATAQNISITGVSLPETHSGTTNFDFTITLSASSAMTVSVDWTTTSGNAVAPGDYIAASGTVSFPPDSTEPQIVTVSVVGDRVYEQNEYFYVQLSNPVNGTIGSGSAIAWIENDDVRISIAGVSQPEGNTGTADFILTVTKSDVYEVPVSVDWATRDGNAHAPDDYLSATGTVIFDPNETVKSVTVSVVGDRVYEQNEYFYVDLSNPVDCSIGTGTTISWIQNDDVRVSIGDVDLAEGNTGTTDYVFSLSLSGAYPFEVSVDWATANGSAVTPGDYIAASGTAVFPPGTTDPQTVTASVVGEADYEPDEYFRVLLSNPVNGSIHDGTGYGWIRNDDIRVSIADRITDEGDSGATDFVFDVTLSAAYGLPTSVDWATADSTASAPDDYVTASGTVDFPIGETLRTVTVQVVGDLAREQNEQFEVRLSNPVNMSIGDGVALGLITNDDSYPEVTIHDAAHFEGNSGTGDFELPVTLSAAYVEEVRVYYTTSDGTAVAPDDYISTTSSVIFPPGETDGVATVPVVGNHEVEPDETFEVTLFSPSNATIADGTAVATILNDDLAGDLFIDNVSLSEGDAGTTDFVFTVSLAESNPATVQVDYATADGTAMAGLDYLSASGTVTFDPGEVDKPVTVQVIGDTMDECFEEFSVLLSSPVNGTIGDGEGTGTILSDDVLACDDSDGDCFHDVGCGGRDCDDAVAATYPEALEVNDALDNQCPGDHGYGVVDEICGVCGFLNPADATELSWPAQASATSYDVARSTVPDFSSDCTLLPVSTNPYILDPTTPTAGQVLFYLVRPLATYLGSWGQDSARAERIFTCP